MGDHVPYESLYERTALLELDRPPAPPAEGAAAGGPPGLGAIRLKFFRIL